MFIRKISAAAIAALSVVAGSIQADDTELYVYESSSRTGSRPQVLIIFDNSGSMKNLDSSAEVGYDPTETYPAYGSDNSLQDRMVYFTKGGIDNTGMPVPDSPSEWRRFNEEVNGCETSWHYLDNYGFFTGFIREYGVSARKDTWEEIKDNNGAETRPLIDCYEDIENGKWRNAAGQVNGFPVDGRKQGNTKYPYTEVDGSSSPAQIADAIAKAKQTEFGTGQPVTLYTDNYLRWYHGDKELVPQSRLDIAKEVIRNTVVTTPGVDFGLAVFNYDFPDEGDQDGGRIVAGIQQMTESNKIDLLNTINDLDPETNTPLCETLFEAKRYFAGESVMYALENKRLKPARDTSIEQGKNYISPYKECQNQAFIVYITDGAPTLDRNADSDIKKLPNVNTTPYQWKIDGKTHYNFLPNLAEWMYTQDVNAALAEQQTVKTFTIGFSEGADDAAPLLKEAAKLGGGEYFAANNASQLQAALQQVFSDILQVNASFTSPSIASNNFDRTHTLDSVYYAMFLPQKGPRWMGNLKKLRVTSSGLIVDKNNQDAIDANGNIDPMACTYWTSDATCSGRKTSGDGNDVSAGGAAEMLRTASSRKLLGNFGANGALQEFSVQQAISSAGSESALAVHMGVNNTELEKLFNWAKGLDVDDENGNGSTTDKRDDILGDPLHSKPLAINFGSQSTPDIRILMGTNHGFMHMFRDTADTVSESWAFMPYELLPNLSELLANNPTGVHSVYGLDSPPVSYVESDKTGITKAWVFFGMRRGGKSYYALDITTPDQPKLMWQLSSDTPNMTELGQTWSEPVITKIPGWPTGNTDAKTARPVLIFGAGYSTLKDATSLPLADSEGRGVFIVDAQTGELVHSFGASGSGAKTVMNGLVDSIPNAVAVLDSNSDGLTDRIYATDTGANVWRIDMPSVNPADSKAPWSAFKFASLGGNTLDTNRRFFAEPVVAQTMFSSITETTVNSPTGGTSKQLSYQNVPYDAVVIGTGMRPSPTNTARQDMFFTLQDRNVVTKSFGTSTSPPPKTLTISDLYNVTSAPPVSQTDNVAFGSKRGWYYNYSGTGEKSLSAAAIVLGRVYFSTYVPGDTSAENVCLALGQGRFYGFDLHRGTRVYNQEYLEMGEQVPDTPQLVIPPGGDNMYFIGIGNAGDNMQPVEPAKGCDPNDPRCIGGGMRANRIYYYTR
ncbi:PilC/PilY family type IV pilus protein [Shewanella sp. GXUN23E]|uniref:PilC/PilY family type IV pilus protein n=1 Tax=Shewanella sp. GXUN23E TaxID=3422498 RepID=UPI003D7F06E8